jgi:chemosensory pili system protein ChpA (sensor histidine kinase/response regulator)
VLADQRALADRIAKAQAAMERAADADARRAARSDLAQSMRALTTPPEPVPPAPATAPAPAPGPAAAPAAEAAEEDDDREMREIFLEEAREVVQGAREAQARLARGADPDAVLEDMTVVRRAFHTLKGSSRMVGLDEFGEAAWACEQLYNTRLADGAQADGDLLGFTEEALAHLADWIEAIAGDAAGAFRAAPVVEAATALRVERRRVPIGGAAPQPPADTPAAVSAVPALADIVPEVPLAEDLDLSTPPPVQARADEVRFELDLGTGAVPEAEAPAPAVAEAAPGHATPEPLPAAPAIEFEPADIGMAATVPMLAPMPGPEAPQAPLAPAPEAIAPIVLDFGPEPTVAPADLPGPEPGTEAAAETAAAAPAEESFKVVGPLRIDIAMFNIFLNEADELSRRLGTELAEWSVEPVAPPGETAVVLAHSLAGGSGTVGFADLSTLARALEHALARSNEAGRASAGEGELYNEAAAEIRRLLHQFAAGFLKTPTPGLVERLNAHHPLPAEAAPEAAFEATPHDDIRAIQAAAAAPARHADVPDLGGIAAGAEAAEADEVVVAPEAPILHTTTWGELEAPAPVDSAPHARPDAIDDEEGIDAVDAIDPELYPIFAEEAVELLPQLRARMRDWSQRPADAGAAAACMRTLHTFKGGARLAGAMRLGEMAHRLETAVEHLLARGDMHAGDVDPLVARVDAIEAAFEALGAAPGEAPAAPASGAPALAPVAQPVPAAVEVMPAQPVTAPGEPQALAAMDSTAPAAAVPEVAPLPFASVDWSAFAGTDPAPEAVAERPAPVSAAAVRVRAPLLDRLVNQAGEVSIARARIETDVAQLKGSLGDLTENLERLRKQLRDIELQAESQINSRLEAAKAAAAEFDPLEMDRFTRFQELTRMMAESVNDVATVQRGLQRTLQSTEDELAAQARLTRGLQDDLLRTRMVEFEALADRLYRVVRQAAKETHKQVRLDIVGGSIEMDRGVLDRMTGPFEHLLRNAVAHGIEAPSERAAAGKDASGEIRITLAQEGNEVAVEFRDDGAGLDLARIRARGIAAGLLAPDAQPSDAELADLIFRPGFSTAGEVTELAGRGIGMDVVRSEVVAMGGRIETASSAGQGTRFRLVLPLTTAVTQVVLLRCGERTVSVPSTLVEAVRRASAADIDSAYASGAYAVGEASLPFFWLDGLLQGAARGTGGARNQPVVVIRSAQQRVALHVDEVVGNQEVVVKNLGPQLSRLPGLAGMTLLPSGAVAPIYNPVALAALFGDAARERARASGRAAAQVAVEQAAPVHQAPLVLVVDDSLTVRRVTQRLLKREGYRVTVAKDGLDALEKLAEEMPAVVLSDIEMPRMDGFDLVRNLRADARLAALPVIMITSRIAQKHRDYAAELGVNHYLGKPYGEDELLALVARYAQLASVH